MTMLPFVFASVLRCVESVDRESSACTWSEVESLTRRAHRMTTLSLSARPTPSPQRGSGGGSSKSPKKKRAKKDKNAPKGAMSAFMQFSQAKRSEVSKRGI